MSEFGVNIGNGVSYPDLRHR